MPKKISISAWAEEDRPREKFLHWGKSTMTDSELLSIIIGSGNKEMNALQIAQSILSKYSLSDFIKLRSNDLTHFQVIGPAKAVNILAAVEIGKRVSQSKKSLAIQLSNPEDSYDHIRSKLEDLPHEEFWVMYLNQANRLISMERISIGGLTETTVDVRIVFQKAILHNAVSITLAHNHPSGTLRPSDQDLNLTKKIKHGATFFNIRLNDHLIITSNGFYSMHLRGDL